MDARKKRHPHTKLSFHNEFYSDLDLDEMLFAVLVRSPAETGTVVSVKPPALPDGYHFFTAHDVPGTNLLETPVGPLPLFSEGTVLYRGEPLGILVGPDTDTLHELCKDFSFITNPCTIEALCKQMEHLRIPFAKPHGPKACPFSAMELFNSHEQAAHDEPWQPEKTAKEIVSRRIQRGSCFVPDSDGTVPGIQTVFGQSAHVLRSCWTYSLRSPDSGEPNGALCSYSDSQLTVYTPTQWLSNLRASLSATLGIDGDDIMVKKTKSMNIGTNSMWYNSLIACQVALASLKTERAVKLVFSREEQERYMNGMRPITVTHTTGIDANGLITAMQVDIDVDAGAGNYFAPELLDRLVIAACGCYNPPAVSITATAYSSENPASSVDVHQLDSAAFFAVENQMNELCAISGITPLELRLKNIAACSGKKIMAPFTFKISKPAETIRALMAQTDFTRKYASYKLAASLRTSTPLDASRHMFLAPLRGIGFSCGFEGSGYFGSKVFGTKQALEVSAETDGSITIHSPPISCAIQSIWTKIASDTIGIAPSQVNFNSLFETQREPPLPENVYNNISVMTVLLKKCCDTIKRRAGRARPPYTVKKTISSTQRNVWSGETFSGQPFHNTSFIAASVEVELDPCTFREHIRDISLVIDGGKILNAQAAEASIKLNMQRLLHSMVSDGSLSCPPVHISFIQSEENPMQVGELVYQAVPSAYTAAVSQALGCTINELPLHTDSLYERLSEKRIHEEARANAAEDAAAGEDSNAKEAVQKQEPQGVLDQ